MTDKPQFTSSLQLYRRLLGYTRRYLLALAVSLVGMVIIAASEPGLAAMMKPLMDEGFINKDPQMMRLIPALIVGIVLLRGLATFIAEYSIKWVGRRVVFDIRGQLFDRLVHLPSSFYDANSSSSLISKLIYDVEQLAQAATNALFVLVRSGLTVLGLLAWMALIFWPITLVFLALIPVLAWMVRVMSHRLRRTSYRIQKSMGDIAKAAQEAAEGQRVVKAFCAQEQEKRTFFAANNYNRQQAMKQVTVAAAGVPLTELVAAIAVAIVIYVALFQAVAGHISAGGFISYLTAMALLMVPAKRLTGINQVLQMGLAASHSAFSLLDQAPEPDTGTVEKERLAGRVEYKGVGFRYPVSPEAVLIQVSFTVEPGQMLALVGASGSGKTTLASLLARFYLVDTGEILVDGININDFRLENLRRHIALVSQETILFDDSLRNNIAYGHDGPIDTQRLQAAVETAHVLEFSDKLPDGLDTLVGEKGLRLSGGQRQRIAIARAMYKDAPILILDEATSALDTESERHVQAAMEALTSHRTTIVIAHRLSTIERADRIVVMKQGRVVETGSHRELLRAGGVYAVLHNMQFRDTG